MKLLPTILLALSLTACGDKDDDAEEGEPGAACDDGTECISGEICVFQVADTDMGTCTAVPDGCAAECGGDCELSEALCDTDGGSGCVSFGSAVVLECY